MALLLCLTCGLLAWALSWVLCGGNWEGGRARSARLQSLRHAARRLLGILAKSDVVGLLLTWDSFASVAGQVRQGLERLGARPSVGESAAILALLVPGAALLLGLLSRSFAAVAVVLVCLVAFMRMRSGFLRRQERRELASEMPGVLRTMATALESGNTLVQAIEYVGLHERGHAAEPFVRASLRLRCGMSLDEALEELRRELDAPGGDLMVTALSISQRTGSPLRSLLQRSAVLVEQQEEFDRLLSVRTAQVRLSVRIVCGLPVLMVVLLSLISPDFQKGLLSGPGMASLLMAAAMDSMALIIIRRILGGVL